VVIQKQARHIQFLHFQPHIQWLLVEVEITNPVLHLVRMVLILNFIQLHKVTLQLLELDLLEEVVADIIQMLVVLVVHLVVVLLPLVQSCQAMLHLIQIILNQQVMLVVMVLAIILELVAEAVVPVVMVEMLQDHIQED
tara:strand:- start:155 stop:571 length:417 start_codon:yes stop_codon:yes gene_type:complete